MGEKGICPTCGQHIRGSYYEEGIADYRFAAPCSTCKHNTGSDNEFPCDKCIDNANSGIQTTDPPKETP